MDKKNIAFVDVDWLENGLSSISDSIRNKTGSSGDLSFPDGMVSAIAGITGGGAADGFATVTFMNGDEVLFSRPVYKGDDCPDPIAQGRIETPTKESTASERYIFATWYIEDGAIGEEALKNITKDTVFHAGFSSVVQTYTINFYDGDTLLASKQVAYGDTPAHEATKDGYSFEGWEPAVVPVTGDASYYATWSENLTFAGSSWSDISDACEAGEASKHFKVGDTRTITAGDYTYVLRIVGMDIDNKADGSGKAGLTVMVDSPATDSMAITSNYMYWGSPGGEINLRTWLSTDFSTRLSPELLAVIKPIIKHTQYMDSSAHERVTTTTDTFFIPSRSEVTADSTNVADPDDIKYPYLCDSASNRVFKNASGTAVAWWTRTSMTNMYTNYYVKTNGALQSDYNGYSKEWYVRPFFCI